MNIAHIEFQEYSVYVKGLISAVCGETKEPTGCRTLPMHQNVLAHETCISARMLRGVCKISTQKKKAYRRFGATICFFTVLSMDMTVLH